MARLDLSGVNISTYLPEGESVCTITKIEAQSSKDKGTPMEVFTFRDRLGREEKQFFVLSDKALFRIKGLAIAAGVPQDGPHWASFDTHSLRGKQLLVIKTKKGMRQIIGQDGQPRDVPEYEFNYAKTDGATATAGGASAQGTGVDSEIPF